MGVRPSDPVCVRSDHRSMHQLCPRLLNTATGYVRLGARCRLLAPLREGVEDDNKGKTVPEEGESAAARRLKMFPLAQSRALGARRTMVMEEVTVKEGET